MRLALVLLLATTAAAAAAPRGRVVRVERSRARTAPPHLCVVMDTADKLLCVGEPKPGDPVSFIDGATGAPLGEMRIESTALASRMGACPGATPMLFEVTASLVSGSLDQLSRNRTVALRGVSLPRQARGLPDYKIPEERNAESLLLALDADGDSRVDTVLYNYSCDQNGLINTAGSTERQCFDTYQDRGGRLVRTQQDILELCY